METSTLKKFAPAARQQLLSEVGARLTRVLTTDSVEVREREQAVKKLREAIEISGQEEVIEKVAYLWFNRLCAFRFMDTHGYTVTGIVSPTPGHSQPEILAEAKQGYIDAAIEPFVDRKKVMDLLAGRIPSSNSQDEACRLLLVGACNYYHKLLPFLFEQIDDYSELLLPGDLLSDHSIVRQIVTEIPENLWQDIEIIGWLYQFYISEKKDEVIGKVVKSEDIPAATQLFTPNWIVKYMVQNSLGAQWLATYPNSPLKGQMEYYIEPAEQTDEVKAQLAATTPSQLNPEELTLIDPASGSGHILVEAYELFKAIYLERGYRQRDVPQLILEKNLFGLDIDERAAQLTGFALMMKGRADDRRLFEREVKLNAMALQDSTGFDVEALTKGVELADYGLKPGDLAELKELFEHATTFGSLIQVPEGLTENLPVLRQLSEATSQDLFASEAVKRLGPLVQQAELLAATYDAVVANPPYMGIKAYCSTLKKFVTEFYKAGKADLYGAFMLRNILLTKDNGHIGMITTPNWMFLSSFEELRAEILRATPIVSLVHNGRGVWGSDFGSCSFVLERSSPSKRIGRFLRLFEKQGSVASNEELERRFHDHPRFSNANEAFMVIPGSPIAYWAPKNAIACFERCQLLGDLVNARIALATGDNARFIRFWPEVPFTHIGFSIESNQESIKSGAKWFPANKGGDFRKWFGNNYNLVNWFNDGAEVKALVDESTGRVRSHNYNGDFGFRESVTWSALSSSKLGVRYSPPGFMFVTPGSSAFNKENAIDLKLVQALLATSVADYFLRLISATMNIEVGDILRIPFFQPQDGATGVARHAIQLTRQDWDAYERSWDFQSFPLLTASSGPTSTLESSYTAWIAQNKDTIAEMKRLEEENNRLFIDAYGLQDELMPDVPIKQITLTVNPAYRYGGKLTEEEQWTRFRQDTMKEFISYAIGCMFGRYSLDKPGLILANQGETLEDYLQKVPNTNFVPDDDNVIPFLDEGWFEDDVTERFQQFLRVTFGEENFAENLRFIEDALGKDIRKYLLKDFYKDHLKNYKKRPIYWMFSSAKGSFNVMIYMHRYRPDTLSVILNDYLREYRSKLQARQKHLEGVSISPAVSGAEKTRVLKELEKLKLVLREIDEYEREVIYPLATRQVDIDLDDGVKVNYNKFPGALVMVPGLSAR